MNVSFSNPHLKGSHISSSDENSLRVGNGTTIASRLLYEI